MQTPTSTPNIILWFSTSKAWEVTKPQAKSVKIVKITFKRSHVFKFAFLLALVFIDFSRDWMRGLHGVSLLYWTCQHYPINQPINVILNVIVYSQVPWFLHVLFLGERGVLVWFLYSGFLSSFGMVVRFCTIYIHYKT